MLCLILLHPMSPSNSMCNGQPVKIWELFLSDGTIIGLNSADFLCSLDMSDTLL